MVGATILPKFIEKNAIKTLAHFVRRVGATGFGPEVRGQFMRFWGVNPKLGKKPAQNFSNLGGGICPPIIDANCLALRTLRLN